MYVIKWAEEAAWAVGIAGAIFILEMAASTERVDDWPSYFAAMGGGLARMVAATLLNQFRQLQAKRQPTPSALG